MKYIKLLIIIAFATLYSCKNNNSNSFSESYPLYNCNLEKLSDDGNTFVDNKYSDITYKGKKLRSNEKAHSGKYSIKLNKKNQFGLTVIVPNIKVNDYYKISVWKYSESGHHQGIIAMSIDGKQLYIQQKHVTEKEKSGWEKLEIKIRIPPFIKVNEMKVYVWQPGENNVFFDDLKIEKVKNVPPSNLDSLALKIFIDDAEYAKLIKIRTEALNVGMLETRDDSWVKGMLFDQNEMFNVKIRLKGDWTDHIQGPKWSFRIKMKKDGAWKGMRVFSIQDPKTRFYQYEWIGHKLLQKEGVLSPRYDYVPVYLNNSYIGIYAFEEHFMKQLPESQKRREGPILKLSETGFWICNKLQKKEDIWYNVPVFESSTKLAYKMDKTLKNNTLKKEFSIGQNLLYQHQFCQTKVSDLIDINLAAKYYAIIDLTKMYHGMRWHNQRFYYNPVTSKLEIIGYDGYTAEGIFKMVNRPIIGHLKKDEMENVKPESRINYTFFTDSVFLEKYVQYLKQYTDTSYLNNLFNSLKPGLIIFSETLEKEYPEYKFDKNFYYTNAKMIRDDLPKYIEDIKSGMYYNINYKDMPKKKISHKMNDVLPSEFIKVFTERQTEDTYTYKIKNFLAYDIETIAIKKETKKKKLFHNIPKIEVQNYNTDKNEVVFNSEFEGNVLIFKVKGSDKEYFAPINPWASPKNETPRQTLLKESKFPITEYFTVKKNEVIFKKGLITINQNIVIPEGYKVKINAGTKLDFINKSFFISYSPVFIEGTEKNKVTITSSDNTAEGFTVLQANEKSNVKFTDFINFNTLNYNNWTLTGAVNFYESDVNVFKTSFINNHCEDALNIVRSDFNVSDCYFKDIFSDAFDTDFCTGKLTKTTFNHIGNDAIDFSGSVVDISSCNINGAEDKGVSGGEKSTLSVNDCTISDVNIGIASKDNSYVEVNNTDLKNCYYGFVALQKKPEYGPATIKANKIKYENLIKLHLIEKKSILYLNKKTIMGYDKNSAKKFY